MKKFIVYKKYIIILAVYWDPIWKKKQIQKQMIKIEFISLLYLLIYK